MKKLIGLAVAGAMLALAQMYQAYAAPGMIGGVTTERGTYANVRNVAVSSVTGTAFFSGSNLRLDGTCRNNSAFTLWVGTVSATINNALHTNIAQGFPVLSSETFKLDGQFRGTMYATCEAAVAACNLRCVDGMVNP
jgi:hypothetical protein